MKTTLDQIRNKDESEMADSDHPQKKDISDSNFLSLLNEVAKESIKIKPLTPISDQEWNVTQEEILKALNNTPNPY